MRVNKVSLETVAGNVSQFPATDLPEFAFIGKSNVGKSSLINAMVNRKSLARTSSAPGKTRTINFYNVEDTLYFVDLPGYGYAKVSHAEQAHWGKVIENYLQNREQLKEAILLIDIRHEPGKGDMMMYDWMTYYGIEPLIIATKSDKIKRSQLQKQTALIARTLKVKNRDRIIPFSSVTKDGCDKLWKYIDAAVMKEQPAAEETAESMEGSEGSGTEI